MGCRSKTSQIKNCLSTHRLSLFIISATILGFCVGLSLRHLKLDQQTIQLIGFPGRLVFRAIILLVVPLLCSSIILGVSSLKKGDNVRLVGFTVGFFIGLQFFCTTLGIVAGQLINPGNFKDENVGNYDSKTAAHVEKSQIVDLVLDMFRNAVPDNIFRATFMQEATVMKKSIEKSHENSANTSNITDEDLQNDIYTRHVIYANGSNYIGLLLFSVVFACAIISLGEKVTHLRLIIEQFNEIIMKMLEFLLWSLLLGMFFWMCEEGLKTQSVVNIFHRLLWFVVTVFGLYVLYQLVILPFLYLLIVKKNPFPFYLNLLPVFLTALGTSSSSATLPFSIRYMEESNKVHSYITRFVLPLGMTIHMDGGCLDFPVEVLFIAHWNGVTVDIPTLIVLCLFIVLFCIASPGVPTTPVPVGLLVALDICGVKSPAYVPLILSMEWLVDRFRTSCNVIGDCYVAAYVEKLCVHRIDAEITNDMVANTLNIDIEKGGDECANEMEVK
ncbi:excitatory amino acid transporter 3-like isoform X1 [Limulus polyphemus]|uniref:Amino acid transporter n=1 Tax=Limulus polyphemus TaxID=6850 RepID=A0ABM1SD37_LIMPO|nr:excitatory amino acid transporter 3-like isoform X1 [Limulus polyphemus]